MRPSRSLLLVVLAALALTACQVGDDAAATVGSTEISAARLQADVPLYEFLAALSGAPCGTPQGSETQTSACTRFTLSNDIREEIVKKYAAAHDLAVSEDDVTGAITSVSQNVGGDQALDEQLKQHGLVRADLEALARRLLLFNDVQQAVTAEKVTDAQLQATYDQNLGQFTTVDVRHILVDSQAQAEKIARTVTDANFADVAAKESIDTQSAKNGGDLGSFSLAQFQQQFDPTFVQAALALRPGEISQPVQTQFGWHIIELVRRDVATFSDVRDQLVSQQAGPVFDQWLVDQLDALGVDVNPRYGRLDASTGEVVPVRSTASGTGSASPSASAPTGSTGGAATPAATPSS
jgi:foldase protein PrsA